MSTTDAAAAEPVPGVGAASSAAGPNLSTSRAGDSAVADFFTRVVPLFPVLSSFDANEPQLLVLAGMAVYLGQHLGFLINPHFRDLWGYILGKDICQILYGFQVPFYDPIFAPDAAAPATVVAMTFAALFLGILLWGVMAFYRRGNASTDKQNAVFVFCNRTLVHALTTCLLIPALQSCFAAMVCGAQGGLWYYPGDPDAVCWGSTHIAGFIGGSLFLVAVLPFCYLALGCQFDAKRNSEHLKAKRHSLFDEVTFVHDVLSCLLFQVLLGYDMNGAFAIIHCVSSALVVAAMMIYQPYYNLGVNQFYCVVHALECLASLLLAAAAYNDAFSFAGASSVLMLGLSPFVVVFAMLAVTYRINPLFLHRLQLCQMERNTNSSRVRAAIQDKQANEGKFPEGLDDDAVFPPFPDLEAQVTECVTRQESIVNDTTSQVSRQDQKMDIVVPYITNVYFASDVDLATQFLHVFNDVMLENPSLSMLLFASKIYSRGIVTFTGDPSLVLYRFAAFIVTYIPSMSFMGLELLEQLGSCYRASFILRYRAVHTAGELRMALGIRNQAHLLHNNKAREMHCKVLNHMNNFWLKLTEPSVNIGLVSEIAEEIHTSRKAALLQFRRALQHQTTSDALLVHRMGDFLRDIMMDAEGANECYNEAKEIHEARQARSMRGTKQHTTVELDVETLTDRLLSLLDGRRESTGPATHTSSVVQYLLLNVTVIFAVLLAVSALFLYLAADQREKNLRMTDRAMSTSVLRTNSIRFAAETYGIIFSMENKTLTKQLGDRMRNTSRRFTNEFAQVTSGPYWSSYEPQVDLFTEDITPGYISVEQNKKALGVWPIVEKTITMMQVLLDTINATGRLSITNSDVQFVIVSAVTISSAFDYSLSLIEEEVQSIGAYVSSFSIALFVIGIVTVAVAYAAFLVSFRRTALGRVFTFQLFTLIPFDDLERLATETKDKVVNILEETRPSHPDDDGNNGPGVQVDDMLLTDDFDDDGNRKMSASTHSKSTSTRSQIISSINDHLHLKSCLKKPGSPPGTKRVQISPIVETFGGKEEDPAAATDGRKTIGSKAHAAAGADDDDEPLLLEKKTGAGDYGKRSRGVMYPTEAKGYFMIAFAVLVLIGLVSVILIGIGVSNMQKLESDFTSATYERIDTWMKVPWMIQDKDACMDRFLFSADIEDLENFAEISNTLETAIESTIGLGEADVDVVSTIARLRFLLLQIQLDAVVLVANENNVSLANFLWLLSRTKITPSVYFQQMQVKYPDVNRSAATLAAGLGIPFTPTVFAKSLLSDPTTSGYRQQTSGLTLQLADMLDLQRKTKLDDEAQPKTVIAALALLVLCMIIAGLISLLRVELITSDYVGRVHFVVLSVFVAIPLALLAAFIAESGHITNALDRAQVVTQATLQTSRAIKIALNEDLTYVYSGRAVHWERFRAADPLSYIRRLPILYEDEGIFDGSSVAIRIRSDVRIVVDSMKLLLHLQEIAAALAIQAYQGYSSEAHMLEVRDQTTWNYALEPDYLTTEEEFPDRWPKASSRNADLSLPRAAQLALGAATLSDDRYQFTQMRAQSAMHRVLQNVSAITVHRVLEAASHARSLLYAALASCAVPLIWCLFIMVRLTHLFTFVMGLQANTNTNSMDTSLYTTLIARCQYALIVLIVFLGASFGVAMWVSTMSYDPVHKLNLATRRNYLVAKSFGRMRSLSINNTRVVAAAAILWAVTELESTIELLHFGLNPQVLYAAGENPTFDRLNFGPDDADLTDAIALSRLQDSCGSLIGSTSLALADHGLYGGLDYPARQALMLWMVLLRRVVQLVGVAETTTFYSQLLVYQSQLQALFPPLMAALDVGAKEEYDSAISSIGTASGVFIGIAAATIGILLLVYLVVFLPTVRRLVNEEESAKLLLRMIPLHVRDQVPAISEFIDTGKIDNAAELQKKFEASEKLLQNILPQKIAARLKSGEQPIADTHPCLTILFTDFVGFTKRSSSMRADEIVDFLNEVFLEFDTIVELLELEKIKTIGDAYFMAGGLDPRISDHAMRVIEAGFKFFQALDEHNARHPDRALLQMRLGVHTGPAVAGVIGTKKVAYDLWGESVEIANAMESTGVPGRVHISQDTANHVTGFYALEPRGELPREKEHIPDCMPATFLVTGRLLPTPYQHIQRPRMMQLKIAQES